MQSLYNMTGIILCRSERIKLSFKYIDTNLMKKWVLFSVASLFFSISNVMAVEKAEVELAPVEVNHSNITLKGLVSDKQTKESLVGVTVFANGKKVYTDLDGNFSVSNLCGGKCQVTVSLISYKDQTIEVDTQVSDKLEVKLEKL